MTVTATAILHLMAREHLRAVEEGHASSIAAMGAATRQDGSRRTWERVSQSLSLILAKLRKPHLPADVPAMLTRAGTECTLVALALDYRAGGEPGQEAERLLAEAREEVGTCLPGPIPSGHEAVRAAVIDTLTAWQASLAADGKGSEARIRRGLAALRPPLTAVAAVCLLSGASTIKAA